MYTHAGLTTQKARALTLYRCLCRTLQLIIDTSASDHPAYSPITATSPLKDLPTSLGKLPQLQQLTLHGCNALCSLPDAIGELASLTKLQLVGCHSLQELPASLAQLQALRSMEVEGANSLEVGGREVGASKWFAVNAIGLPAVFVW
jgi:hypothetical protein